VVREHPFAKEKLNIGFQQLVCNLSNAKTSGDLWLVAGNNVLEVFSSLCDVAFWQLVATQSCSLIMGQGLHTGFSQWFSGDPCQEDCCSKLGDSYLCFPISTYAIGCYLLRASNFNNLIVILCRRNGIFSRLSSGAFSESRRTVIPRSVHQAVFYVGSRLCSTSSAVAYISFGATSTTRSP
jgi:hypothetical protein